MPPVFRPLVQNGSTEAETEAAAKALIVKTIEAPFDLMADVCWRIMAVQVPGGGHDVCMRGG